jgi:hypothetical protein
VRFFVKNVLAGPAYGRNTGALQLKPLGYREAALFLPAWSHEDHVRAYALAGGVPHGSAGHQGGGHAVDHHEHVALGGGDLVVEVHHHLAPIAPESMRQGLEAIILVDRVRH